MERVVVFGATGTIGAYTALHLKAAGYDVVAVGRRATDNGFFASHEIPYHSLDVARPEAFADLPQEHVGSVVHFAGSMPARMKGYEPRVHVESIVLGTLGVLDYARASGASRIVFSHSHADSKYLMGGGAPIPADIEKRFPPTGDHAVYAICKNAAVDLIEHYHHQYGLKRFILRLPTIYAYRPNKTYYLNGELRTLPYRQLIDRAMAGLPIEIWGDPARVKEVVYINDFLQIVELAVKSTRPGGVYNVGGGAGITLEEQVRGIVEVFCPPDRRSRVTYAPDRPDSPQFIHDISKTVEELGYRPEWDYLRGLRDFKAEMSRGRFDRLWDALPENVGRSS